MPRSETVISSPSGVTRFCLGTSVVSEMTSNAFISLSMGSATRFHGRVLRAFKNGASGCRAERRATTGAVLSASAAAIDSNTG